MVVGGLERGGIEGGWMRWVDGRACSGLLRGDGRGDRFGGCGGVREGATLQAQARMVRVANGGMDSRGERH